MLEALTREAPDWPAPRHLLARACFQDGDLTRALEHLDWLELHAIEHVELALLRASIEMSCRRFDAALDQADYARHLDDSSPGPDIVIGEVRLRRGELDAAEAAFQRAAELAPVDAVSMAGLAAVALHRGTYETAVDLALQSLECNLELPIPHYRLGVALACRRKYSEARVAFEAFARLSPRRAAPYHWLAAVCEAMGDQAAANDYREQGRSVVRARRARAEPRDREG
jgi:tetratricopeptide (TPR) repeat protein